MASDKKYTDRQKDIIAKALAAQERYGDRDRETKRVKPSIGFRPTGNPFKGKYGFKATIKW